MNRIFLNYYLLNKSAFNPIFTGPEAEIFVGHREKKRKIDNTGYGKSSVTTSFHAIQIWSGKRTPTITIYNKLLDCKSNNCCIHFIHDKFKKIIFDKLSFQPTGTHKGYISKRKRDALDLNKIQEDINSGCHCKQSCLEDATPLSILKWRKKIHLSVMGPEQQQRILDLYRETLHTDKKGDIRHFVEGNIVCK